MSRSSRASDWMANLPWVLLGLRSSTRDDSSISPAHLVYGGPLRLPGEFFSSSSSPAVRTSDFVSQLQSSLGEMTPFPAEFNSSTRRLQPSVPASLATCPAVFVRIDAVKRPLTPPYQGPFEVLKRTDKTFVLRRSGKPWTVSVHRLKPYLSPFMSAPPPLSHSAPTLPSPPAASSQSALPPAASPRHRSPQVSPAPTTAPAPAPSEPTVTRTGRIVRPPDRYSA